MEKQTNERDDQAATLKKLVDEVEEGAAPAAERAPDEQMENKQAGKMESRQVDILNLPPRKEVHSSGNKRTHVKISRPFIRLLIVIIVIIGILAGLYYVWGEELLNLPSNV